MLHRYRTCLLQGGAACRCRCVFGSETETTGMSIEQGSNKYTQELAPGLSAMVGQLYVSSQISAFSHAFSPSSAQPIPNLQPSHFCIFNQKFSHYSIIPAISPFSTKHFPIFSQAISPFSVHTFPCLPVIPHLQPSLSQYSTKKFPIFNPVFSTSLIHTFPNL